MRKTRLEAVGYSLFDSSRIALHIAVDSLDQNLDCVVGDCQHYACHKCSILASTID